MSLPVPIIKMEIKQMQVAVMAVLQNYAAQMDEDIQKAVEEYCTPENLGLVIRQAAKQAIDLAVKEEIQSAFRYNGPGRLAIREMVEQFMDEQFPVEKKD